MKNILFILSLICLIYNCSDNKATNKINDNPILIEKDSIPNSTNWIEDNWIKYEANGYLINPKIATYNNSLKISDSLSVKEDVAQILILEKTSEMIHISDDTCPSAYFLKIKYNESEYIVYGTDIYIIEESFNLKNDIKSISLLSLADFSVGASGENGLTGCDDYHPLIVLENNIFQKIYTIPDNDYYSKKNNLNYYYLISNDGSYEKIEHLKLKNDTVIAKIHVEYQEGSSDYDLNIIKENNGIFVSSISNKNSTQILK